MPKYRLEWRHIQTFATTVEAASVNEVYCRWAREDEDLVDEKERIEELGEDAEIISVVEVVPWCSLCQQDPQRRPHCECSLPRPPMKAGG